MADPISIAVADPGTKAAAGAGCACRSYRNGITAIWSLSGNLSAFADLLLTRVQALDAGCVFAVSYTHLTLPTNREV